MRKIKTCVGADGAISGVDADNVVRGEPQLGSCREAFLGAVLPSDHNVVGCPFLASRQPPRWELGASVAEREPGVVRSHAVLDADALAAAPFPMASRVIVQRIAIDEHAISCFGDLHEQVVSLQQQCAFRVSEAQSATNRDSTTI